MVHVSQLPFVPELRPVSTRKMHMCLTVRVTFSGLCCVLGNESTNSYDDLTNSTVAFCIR